MLSSKAHNLNAKTRTNDVITNDNTTFYHMGLSRNILDGLTNCGFEKPSPVQLKAIPPGRCGLDLIIQAKSGTGKTAVFGIIALDMINVKYSCLQVLILAPTREIAVQISQVIIAIGSEIKGLKVGCQVGGMAQKFGITKPDGYQIIVGTPGRLKYLVNKNLMNADNVRLFVMDEADKLMDTSFRDDIDEIFKALPQNKQVISSSATYPSDLQSYLTKYMRSPFYCSPYCDNTILVGIKQFVITIPSHPNKMKQIQLKTIELTKIFSEVPFKQCLVFLNYQSRVQSVCNHVNKLGFSSTYITGNQDMAKRLDAIEKLKNFECKILFSTDLTARGIDADNLNLIINYDIPHDCATYLHRIGRAGRYGSYGTAINLIAENEVDTFKDIIKPISTQSLSLYKFPDYSKNIWIIKTDELELFSLVEDRNLEQNRIRNNDNINCHNKLYENEESETKDVHTSFNTFDNYQFTLDTANNVTKLDNFKKKIENNEINFKTSEIKHVQELETTFLSIEKFINNLYNTKMDILEMNKKNSKTKLTPTNPSSQSYIIKALSTKPSKFQAWNQGVTFSANISNLIGNDNDYESNIAPFINYRICKSKETNIISDTENDRDFFKSSQCDNIEKSRRLKQLNLIICYERLQETLASELDNVVDKNRVTYKKLLSWKRNIDYEIKDLKKLLCITNSYIKDTGRIWIYKDYWSALKTYFKLQKTVLYFLCYTFSDNPKFEDEYNPSSVNIQNRKDTAQSDLLPGDNFSNEFKLLLPDKIEYNKFLHKLMSEQDINNYRHSVEQIRSHLDSSAKLLQLKTCLFHLTRNEKITLEQQIKAKKSLETLTFDELLEFLEKRKEQVNGERDELQNIDDNFDERERRNKNNNVTNVNVSNSPTSSSLKYSSLSDMVTEEVRYPTFLRNSNDVCPTSNVKMHGVNKENESEQFQHLEKSQCNDFPVPYYSKADFGRNVEKQGIIQENESNQFKHFKNSQYDNISSQSYSEVHSSKNVKKQRTANDANERDQFQHFQSYQYGNIPLQSSSKVDASQNIEDREINASNGPDQYQYFQNWQYGYTHSYNYNQTHASGNIENQGNNAENTNQFQYFQNFYGNLPFYNSEGGNTDFSTAETYEEFICRLSLYTKQYHLSEYMSLMLKKEDSDD